jgi:hypothetical protein
MHGAPARRVAAKPKDVRCFLIEFSRFGCSRAAFISRTEGIVMQPISYDRHRFPPDVIRHAIRLYVRFTLSYRDLEELWQSLGSTSPMKPPVARC